MEATKDYINYEADDERRYAVANMKVEKRADDEGDGGGIVEGYAALFNSPTELYWYREEILPGAFDDVLKDDVRCLFNHDPNQILARCVKGKGTLTLEVDKIGLKYRYTTPDRQFAKDLEDAIDKGDVSQSSFAFRVKESIWIETEGELSLRQIKKIEMLYDVSPVTYPAYQDTSVAKRSHAAFKGEKDTEQRSGENKGLSITEAQLIINQNL